MILIGDLPRSLISLSQWRFLLIDREEARRGDILFVKSKDKEKLLSHAALFLSPDKIFHCSSKEGTAVVEWAVDFFASYEQRMNFKKTIEKRMILNKTVERKMNFNKIIRYIDLRNKKLRKKHNGAAFIEDE